MTLILLQVRDLLTQMESYAKMFIPKFILGKMYLRTRDLVEISSINKN